MNFVSQTSDPPKSQRVWLSRYTKFTALATLFLIMAGGMVTSTGSGLSVPDWPLSYGRLMPPMVGGIFYEHGHRMIATAVGLLTIILAVWLSRVEERRWVRRLGILALTLVVVQGLLGGLTVILLLPAPVSVAHAAVAQSFFCLIVTIALVTSKRWNVSCSAQSDNTFSGVKKWACLTFLAVFIQLLLGATMRHLEAGLIIPDFPHVFGGWWPSIEKSPFDPMAPFALTAAEFKLRMYVHFAHRVWSLVVLILVLMTGIKLWRRRILIKSAGAMMFLVLFQMSLGAAIIWTRKIPIVATAHVATGAVILALSLTVWVMLKRISYTLGLSSKGVSFE